MLACLNSANGTFFLVVVKASTEMRNYNMRSLLCRLDLVLVTGLDIIQVVIDRLIKVLLVFLSVLVDAS